MFGLFKRKDNKDNLEKNLEKKSENNLNQSEEVAQKPRLWERLKKGLSKSSSRLTRQISNLFLGAKNIDEDLLEELETILLQADLGLSVTESIMENLTDQLSRKELKDPRTVVQSLKTQLENILKPAQKVFNIDSKSSGPFVILMVGINGAGKTTTIGKMAHKFKSENKKIMLAAGDTFRAAAVEQLKVWGERNDVPVISQGQNADSASVIYDAMQSAQAKNSDILIADTAGRLHNKEHLMRELEKIIRVIRKINPNAPHEIMLVLDASNGQNALTQAEVFSKAVNITGLTVTKLDGSSKGGVLFAIVNSLKIPVRFIGVGEHIEDLQTFNAQDFVDAILSDETE